MALNISTAGRYEDFMTLKAFDHVNILTSNLDAMIAWYGDILGLKSGARPDFDFPGAWLYLGDAAVLHLVGVDDAPKGYDGVRMEHVAFSASGYDAFIAKLKERKVEHRVGQIPGTELMQVNVHDPDGNHLHIDFDLSVERAG